MPISTIEIFNFRNVKYKFIELYLKNAKCSLNAVFTGKNMSGKTNTLNAIHWAFTGTTMDGDNNARANFPTETVVNGEYVTTKVEITFDDGWKFKRECSMVDGTPTITISVNGETTKTLKAGEAMLHAHLGLSDLILRTPKDFDIVKFLLNPLYFDTISPSALRKFMYLLSNLDFDEITEKQPKAVVEVLKKRDMTDPYKLGDAISKDKKATKKVIDACKLVPTYFPSIKEEANAKLKEENKKMTLLENEEALANKYALAVSKAMNKYYKKAMGIEICVLEEGVGDDVFKDVCYPILPKSKLPFAVGSNAERTYVGIRFIQEVCLNWNIKPLPILIDNMESLDEDTTKYIEQLNVQYIGTAVTNDKGGI